MFRRPEHILQGATPAGGECQGFPQHGTARTRQDKRRAVDEVANPYRLSFGDVMFVLLNTHDLPQVVLLNHVNRSWTK